jgi:hypothetical protein
VNNFPYPVWPGKSDGAFLQVYYSQVLLDPYGSSVVPSISSNSTTAKLIGTVPLVADTNIYPATIIDLYIADPEGIAFGSALQDPLMTNGYVQGKVYLGSFVDNSAADKNPNPGEFEFDISSLNVSGQLLTITANYSQAPAGRHNAIVMTSPFSDPVIPGEAAGGPKLVISKGTEGITISWTGSGLKLQTSPKLPATSWTDVSTTGNSYLVPTTAGAGFYRLSN